MKKILTSGFILFTMIFLPSIYGQAQKATDYLGLPGPISFDGKSYRLAWSSHPTPAYYKQEYIVAGDKLERFNTMILVEVLTGATTAKDAATAKLGELKKMKASNPMVNYDWFENKNTGEFMLDFLLSQPKENGGGAAIVERNVYRYISLDAGGKKGLVLFAVSTRSYGNKIDGFLTALKKTKNELVNKVAAYKLSPLSVSK